jgi:CIC family chloride channel protein
MAIVMLFELTLNYQILIPVMLASVAGYYVCRSLTTRSLYGDSLLRKGAAIMARYLATVQLRDLIQLDKGTLPASASFGTVAKTFLQSRHDFLHIEDRGHFIGAISLQDIKPYLDQKELENLLIAKDLVREDHPRLHANYSLAQALETFGNTDVERLPVTERDNQFLGVITKSDLLLLLAGKPRQPAGVPA